MVLETHLRTSLKMPVKRALTDPETSALQTPPKKQRQTRAKRVLPSPPTSAIPEPSPAYQTLADIFSPSRPPSSPYLRLSSTPFPSTPLSARTRTPAHPSDSPGNPLGPARVRHLRHALPEPSRASRHVALRVQVVHAAAFRGAGDAAQGVFRIVQVPLNYTFRHLHALLCFLFDQQGAAAPAHVFEVQDEIVLHPQTFAIRDGRTLAKLSRSYVPYEYDKQVGSGSREPTPEPWTWENEDEYTLERVWPDGLGIERGVIYAHSPLTALHITIHFGDKLEQVRRAASNAPYVYHARGALDLRREIASVDERDGKLRAVLRPKTPSPGADEDEEENPFLAPKKRRAAVESEDERNWRWNAPGAFAEFFAGYAEDAEGGADADGEGEVGAQMFSPLSSSPSASIVTPAPVRTEHRMRVDNAARRLRKLSQKLSSPDREEAKAKAKEKAQADAVAKVKVKSKEWIDDEDEEDAEPIDYVDPEEDDAEPIDYVDPEEEEEEENIFDGAVERERDAPADRVRGCKPQWSRDKFGRICRSEERLEEEEEEGGDTEQEEEEDGGGDTEVEETPETEQEQRGRARAFWNWSPDPYGLKEQEV